MKYINRIKRSKNLKVEIKLKNANLFIFKRLTLNAVNPRGVEPLTF
jgi:hypothetical protein